MKSYWIKAAHNYSDDDLLVLKGVQPGWTQQYFETNI